MIPIGEQIEEVERELRHRARLYPLWIDKGRLKLETAHVHTTRLQAALATLRVVEAHADGLRALIALLRAYDPVLPPIDEREKILEHPAVRQVLAAFPGAVLTAIRPVAYPGPDEAPVEPETEEEPADVIA